MKYSVINELPMICNTVYDYYEVERCHIFHVAECRLKFQQLTTTPKKK